MSLAQAGAAFQRVRDVGTPMRENCEQTLAAVYRKHAEFVWRLCRRFGVAQAELEDVVHDVFLVVHRRLSQYDGRAGMRTWLFHLTRGVVSNRRRGQVREARRLQLVESEPRPLPACPERHSDRKRAAAFVRNFLETLRPEQKVMFEMVELQGFRVAEAAQILEVNPNTAHARLRAARLAFGKAVRARLSAESRGGAS